MAWKKKVVKTDPNEQCAEKSFKCFLEEGGLFHLIYLYDVGIRFKIVFVSCANGISTNLRTPEAMIAVIIMQTIVYWVGLKLKLN